MMPVETLTQESGLKPAALPLRAVVNDALFDGIVARMVAGFHPYKIILFGSYAYGTPHNESDIDLLVIMDCPDNFFFRTRSALKDAAQVVGLSMDVLLYTPQQIETRCAMGDFFVNEILSRGRVLYDCGKKWPNPEIKITMTLTEEWIKKAEGDYTVALAVSRLRKNPQPDNVCYHCQQCAEKYLKAFLVHYDTAPPRTHELPNLLRDCLVHDAALQTLAPDLQTLNPYGVEVRYPNETPVVPDVAIAVPAMKNVRKFIRKKLGL